MAMESISTMSTTYSESSKLEVTIPADGTYDTKTYLYWGEMGYLVVDYRTNPGTGGIWALYNKPDPAFILPWYGFPDETTGQFPPVGEPDAPPCNTPTDRQAAFHPRH